jgi:hypothetical protein
LPSSPPSPVSPLHPAIIVMLIKLTVPVRFKKLRLFCFAMSS